MILKLKYIKHFVYIFYLMCICREFGLQHTTPSIDDNDLCSVCLERSCSVAAEGGTTITLDTCLNFT
jgi:hypothetical protein